MGVEEPSKEGATMVFHNPMERALLQLICSHKKLSTFPLNDGKIIRVARKYPWPLKASHSMGMKENTHKYLKINKNIN